MENGLKIQIYADGADIVGIRKLYKMGCINGFTTNPTLMRKAGITDYESFAKEVLLEVTDRPISFEVFSDDFDDMERQARKIGGWGDNVFIKIPVTNTKGEASAPLIEKLSNDGFKLNITAILTLDQVCDVLEALNPDTDSIISVFAGRIADTGIDPCPVMKKAADMCKNKSKNMKSLWASTRELLNIFQAQECGIDIITVTHDILRKIPTINKDLKQLSLETVKMFYNDAISAGYML